MAQMMAIDLVDEMPDTEEVSSRRGHPHSCWVLPYTTLHVWLLRDGPEALGCWVAVLVGGRFHFWHTYTHCCRACLQPVWS